MDLLFSRYASPFLLLDNMIMTGRLSEFVSEIMQIRNAEKDDQTLWEYFLHKVFDKSYADFLREAKNPAHSEAAVSQDNLETTIKDSYNMLNDFKIVR